MKAVLNTLIFRIKRLVNGIFTAVMIVSLIGTLVSSAGPVGPAQPPVTQPLNTVPADTDPGAPKITLCEGSLGFYTIIRGKSANRSEVHAALELQAYLKKISGAAFPVLTDDVPPHGKEIIVGKTNRTADTLIGRGSLGDDGYRILSARPLSSRGGARHFYVYAFLEDFIGCRFFTRTWRLCRSS